MRWGAINYLLLLYYLDKVCADVVLLHGCPQSCMQNPVEGLLEVYKDMVEAEGVRRRTLASSLGPPRASEASEGKGKMAPDEQPHILG